jgi:hypothetical protein
MNELQAHGRITAYRAAKDGRGSEIEREMHEAHLLFLDNNSVCVSQRAANISR